MQVILTYFDIITKQKSPYKLSWPLRVHCFKDSETHIFNQIITYFKLNPFS
jgi:hypothetical protein